MIVQLGKCRTWSEISIRIHVAFIHYKNVVCFFVVYQQNWVHPVKVFYNEGDFVIRDVVF